MRHTIPTLLETKDHIIFGLTAKQSLLLMSGVGSTGLLWETYHDQHTLFLFLLFLVISCLPSVFALLLAFVIVANHTLDEWLLMSLLYLQAPKIYVWMLIPHEYDEASQHQHPTVESEKED